MRITPVMAHHLRFGGKTKAPDLMALADKYLSYAATRAIEETALETHKGQQYLTCDFASSDLPFQIQTVATAYTGKDKVHEVDFCIWDKAPDGEMLYMLSIERARPDNRCPPFVWLEDKKSRQPVASPSMQREIDTLMETMDRLLVEKRNTG